MSAPELVKRLRVWRAEVTAADDARFRMIGEAADMIEALSPEREANEIVEAAMEWGAAETPEQECESTLRLAKATVAYRALKSPTPQTAGREE